MRRSRIAHCVRSLLPSFAIIPGQSPRVRAVQDHSLLQSVLVFLVAVVIAVPLARRLKLGSVLGSLAAGTVIRPYGLKGVQKPEGISGITELGVALLLFVLT